MCNAGKRRDSCRPVSAFSGFDFCQADKRECAVKVQGPKATEGLQDVQDINVSDGMLSVTVVEAKNIPKGDLFTESNPYVV